MRLLHPDGWPRARGYANGVEASGRLIFVAGQIGWTPEGVFEARDFVGQFRQALSNTLAVLAEADAGPEHVVRMTWFILDRDAYLARLREIGAVWRELMGPHYPAMSVVQVSALVEDLALLEIETTAVVG